MERYEEALKVMCKHCNIKFNKCHCETKARFEELLKEYNKYKYELEETLTYLNQYEKALDKACDELASYDYKANLKPYQYDTDYTTSEEWKEWCMNND